MGTIIYLIGLVLAILAVIDIFKKPISLVGKIICAVVVLATSWIGLLIYYLYAKNHITEWFKSASASSSGWCRISIPPSSLELQNEDGRRFFRLPSSI